MGRYHKLNGIDKNLDSIRKRARIDSMVKRAYLWFLALSAVYIGVLFVSRLTGLVPDYFSSLAVLIPPILGIFLGLLLHRRYHMKEIARITDAKLGTKDLFFTSVLLDSAYGEYRPLLQEKAEIEAEKIKPDKIIEFRWFRQARNTLSILALLLLLSIFLPQLDPFGKKLLEKKRQENSSLLNKMDEEVKKRLELLKRKSESKNSPEVAKTLDELKNAFNKMKVGEKKINVDKLKDMQKNINALLKNANDKKLQDMLGKKFSPQSFGRNSEKLDKWRKELRNGDFSGLKKEIRELGEMAKKMSSMQDSTEKQKMADEMAKRMKELMEMNKSELGSKSVQMALETAMKELGMSDKEANGKEAMSAAANSAELAERELERLEEMMNDMESLESAAKAAQLAKMLNELDTLEKASGEGFQEIADYEKFYKELMKRRGEGEGEGEGDGYGNGNGTGGHGTGKGGKPGENDSIKTDFKSEISKSKLQPGKTLMEWKTKQITDSGMVKEEYPESLKEVKQGVSEAIVKEQVPPGYHDAIKNYFGTLGTQKDKSTPPPEKKD